MKLHLAVLPLTLALTVSACGGSSTSSPLDDEPTSTGDAAETPNTPVTADPPTVPEVSEPAEPPAISDAPETPEPPATPDVPETSEPPATPDTLETTEPPVDVDTPVTLQTPEFRGELVFASEQRLDLDPLLNSVGLDRARDFVIASDGESIRTELVDDRGAARAIALVDVDSLTTELLATDLGDNTSLLFDANNQPVAVFANACNEVTFTPLFDNNVFDLTSLLAEGECLFDEVTISADGNVALFFTFADGTDPFDAGNSVLRAYTFNAASLSPVTDFNLEVDGATLTPELPPPFGFEQILSANGRHYFAQQSWAGTDANGNRIKQVGAILWDTLSGALQIRGREDDLRTCVSTSQVNCTPPYFYAMSSDGERQYFSRPTAELLENPNPMNTFVSALNFADTGSPEETLIGDTGTVRSVDTNTDGDLLVLQAGDESETLSSGYALYQASSGVLMSLNGTFNECELLDDNGNSADDSRCVFSTTPFSLTGDGGVQFTASGLQALFRSISRVTAEREQSVEDFLLDVSEAALYTLPPGFSGDPDAVNADASVLIGNTDFPDFDVLIGRR